jgi:UDP-N-acetylglucosamine 4,6-dehydratase
LFSNKKILITGGTGSLGTELTKKILETDVDVIRIYSRGEGKQIKMQSSFNDKRLRFFIGDVRDKERLERALENIDIVIHAAALKHVPVAEYNPFEAVKTNVNGSQNLIDVCLDKNVSYALAIGTDKAVSPLNTYGATKLLMERLFVSANYYRGRHATSFFGVRYGNVMGSSGSIIPLFFSQIKKNKKITVTNSEMTRFNITMDEALDLIMRSLDNPIAGQILVPKLKAYRLQDIIEAIIEITGISPEIKQIGLRAGEKMHETLINKNELRNTYDNGNDYTILEKQNFIQNPQINNLKQSDLHQEYSSNKVELLTKKEIINIMYKQNLVPDD